LGLVRVSIKRASLDAPTQKNLLASMTDAPLARLNRLILAKRVWEIGGSSLEPPPTPASSRTRIRFAAGEPKADV